MEVAIRTHLPRSRATGTHPFSRNHINVLSADAVVALAGSAGTRSEIALALRYGRRLALYDRPPPCHAAQTAAAAKAGILITTDLGDLLAWLHETL